MGGANSSRSSLARPTIGRLWITLFLAAQAVLWSAVVVWDPPQMEGPLKVAVGLWPGSETLTIARERGLLIDDTIRIVEMTWSSAAMRAFGNRVVDAAVLSLDEVLRLRQTGQDVRVVMVMDVSAGADSLMGLGGIRETAGLRGRKVGVELRTAGMYLLARALERAGMALNDVEIIPLNLAETEAALLEGEVDAVVTSQPWQSRLLEAGATNLFDSSMIPQEVCRLLVIRGDVLEPRRQELQRMVDAHFEVLEDMALNLSAGEKNIITRREGVNWDAFATAGRLIVSPSRTDGLRLMQGSLPPLDVVAERVVGFMVKTELLPSAPDRTNWIETSFLEQRP